MTIFGIELNRPTHYGMFIVGVVTLLFILVSAPLAAMLGKEPHVLLGWLFAMFSGAFLAACDCSASRGLKHLMLIALSSVLMGALGRTIGLLVL